MSPVAFLQKPARWMQLLATNSRSWSRLRRTSRSNWRCDGRRMTTWPGWIWAMCWSSSTEVERIHAATIRRFSERFARFNLPDTAMRPSYGLAEATVYVVSARPGHVAGDGAFRLREAGCRPCEAVRRRRRHGAGQLRPTHGRRRCASSIPRPGSENPAGKIGEIWVHGDNVARGYWRNPELSERTFGAELVDPSPGTPQGPWLRTGDLGVMSRVSCSSSAASRIC